MLRYLIITFVLLPLLAVKIFCKTTEVNPSNYLSYIKSTKPGDTLLFVDGEYLGGMNLTNVFGTNTNYIVYKSKNLHQAVFIGREGSNTIDIRNSCFIKIEGFKLDGKNIENIDGIKAGGTGSDSTNGIWLDNNYLVGHGNNQQTCGISTKITSRNWRITNNVIIEPGTALYLGNSDGSAPFINGIIEFNLVINPIGYCMQIKHQNSRNKYYDVPDNAITIIRHNVFAKDDRPSPDGDRPNLLVGGQPLSGTGLDDRVEIYGNLLYYNPREFLFQGTGNISLHNNLFLNSNNGAINFQTQNSRTPKEIFCYNNSIYTYGTGIALRSFDKSYSQVFLANAVFANNPNTGFSSSQNILLKRDSADYYFNKADDSIGKIDFYPKTSVHESNTDILVFSKDTDYNKDFNLDIQSGRYYGAYSGKGINYGWKPSLEIKKILKTNTVDFCIPMKQYEIYWLGKTLVITKIAQLIDEIATIQLYDCNGNQIASNFLSNKNGADLQIDFSDFRFASGVYILFIKTKAQVISARVLTI